MKKIAVFAHEIYEDMELQYPKFRLLEAGFDVAVVGEERGAIYKGKHGYPVKCDISYKDLKPGDFAGVVVPGGYAPDKVRQIPEALSFLRELDQAQKPIAFICHGGWVPVSAGILKGKRVTGYAAIKDDLINAGAKFEDSEVVVEGHLVSSRKPPDLPAFMKAFLALF